jgi:glucokinase
MKNLVVAVDLGGTNIRSALCDVDGKILNRDARQTAPVGNETAFSRIVASLRTAVNDWSDVCAIGLCAPGPLDPWQGIILESPNVPGMNRFPLKAELQKEFAVPVYIGNDANVAGLGEYRYGAGRGVRFMIYITLSTGIGAGIIDDGKLLLGSRGFAGEVGHQTLDVNGPLCNCGNLGCLEVLAAGPAIVRDVREALRTGRKSKISGMVNGDFDKITGATITQAAQAGDTLALEIYKRAGRYYGFGLVNLLHNFDTQLFVLGGSVAVHAWEFIYPSMIEVLDNHSFKSMREGVRVVQAQLGDDVGLLGAAALANESMRQ